MGADAPRLNYYEVLNITQASPASPAQDRRPLRAEDLRAAYRRALLMHHPDKSSKGSSSAVSSTSDSAGHVRRHYTIDEITAAYQTLSNPSARKDYDHALRSAKLGRDAPSLQHFTGLETVDLDDLAYDEDVGVWARACRCGDEKGYQVSEEDLEREAGRGEVIVECRGCSLCFRIVFQVAEDT